MRSESSAVRLTALGIQKLPPLRSSTCLLTRMSYHWRAVIAPRCLVLEWNVNTPSALNRTHFVVPALTSRPVLLSLSGRMSTPGGSANLTTLPVATSPSTAPVNVVAAVALSHDTSTIVGLAGAAGAAGAAEPGDAAGAASAEPAAAPVGAAGAAAGAAGCAPA